MKQPSGVAPGVMNRVGNPLQNRRGRAADLQRLQVERHGKQRALTQVGEITGSGRSGEVPAIGTTLDERLAAAIRQRHDLDQNILQVLPAEIITSLPNANVADAIGRLPSVTLERDEGEGKYVQIRGTEPRLSNVTIDGVSVASPESVRQIKLDIIPSDLVESVEINKTLAGQSGRRRHRRISEPENEDRRRTTDYLSFRNGGIYAHSERTASARSGKASGLRTAFNSLVISASFHKTLRVTPAMESNLTDHVWYLAELLGASISRAGRIRLWHG
jgi:TonB-dependent Receptor Plug Domain